MTGKSHTPPAGTKLSCSRVWKIYGPKPMQFLESQAFAPSTAALRDHGYIAAVCDVSLEVRHGEMFVIMGLSGSGKSTLVRCLSRLVEPTTGEILFDGRDLLKLSEKEMIEIRRHKMAMVFQHFALLPHDTVLGNVAFPLEIQGLSRQRREHRALELIELVGLKSREDYYPHELSGGQQQRVGIARALAVDPEVLFLDEPFSALDPLIRHEMQSELMRLQDTLQKTVVFITHDFDEAIRLADRIAIMQDGKIVQIGTPEELVVNPATSYVRKFTRDVPRAKVLSVRSVMRPFVSQPTDGIRVKARDKIETVLEQMIDTETDATVVDDSGLGIGILTRRDVLKVLANKA